MISAGGPRRGQSRMLDRLRRRLTYANVMATIAAFGVLAGGGAYAASKIGTNDIKNGAVTTKKIKNGAVTRKKLKPGAVPKVDRFSRSGAVPFGSPATLVSLGGLRLEYACTPSAPDILTFRARTTVDGARIWLARNFFGGGTVQDDQSFNTGDTFSLVGFVGTGVYSAPGGKVVTFTYRNSLDCTGGVAGTAYGG
jgi:hypothetical protein